MDAFRARLKSGAVPRSECGRPASLCVLTLPTCSPETAEAASGEPGSQGASTFRRETAEAASRGMLCARPVPGETAEAASPVSEPLEHPEAAEAASCVPGMCKALAGTRLVE